MKIFKTKKELQDYLETERVNLKKIALIPTMGALHEGHISLLNYAKPLSDIRVCSIFVNPTQFNDPKDLEKYPRPLEQDIQLLEAADCDVLFLPSVAEMYPDPQEKWHIDLNGLDEMWEGKMRPGHFQGVTQVVYKLFHLVQPDIACFGQKDFQQVMVIQHMIKEKNLPITIALCPTIRDKNGLALSSRNMRLSANGKTQALALSSTLQFIKDNFAIQPLAELQEQASDKLQQSDGVSLEYLAICETTTLHQANVIEPGKKYVALVTAWVEDVRLIDNMILN
ncbi:pantoate--beta-alanine ligase [Sphingobacterium sp. SRCM116780]|uniref:pantoate--beta-alanine ligase n=1 Tax=Sphingobacterium sp. SRCM116780 TaxID=2907623 RepID=UPI001F15B568|nr:pantoate--beta-alanine ligase [Sphingobacterium sp. SRCM116780]UIR56241.1 pantoate--beta-alanine ligase [Sphingobacterium sp. SRCM116780]